MRDAIVPGRRFPVDRKRLQEPVQALRIRGAIKRPEANLMTVSEVTKILDAGYGVECLLPAKRGDVSKVSNDGAEIICPIYGVFFQDSAAAHREIPYALKNWVKVTGSPSMRTLRASELDLYGMKWVGKIYE